MVERIDAAYMFKTEMVGHKIRPELTVIHADISGSIRYQVTSGYALEPDYIQKEGPNVIKVSFSDKVAYMTIQGTMDDLTKRERTEYEKIQDTYEHKGLAPFSAKIKGSTDAIESGTYIEKDDLEIISPAGGVATYREEEMRRLANSEFEITSNNPRFRGLEYNTGIEGGTVGYNDRCPYSGITVVAGGVYMTVNVSTLPKYKNMIAWFEGLPVSKRHPFEYSDIIVCLRTDANEWERCPIGYPNVKLKIKDENEKRLLVSVDYVDPHNSDRFSTCVYVPKEKEDPDSTMEFTVILKTDRTHGEDVTDMFKFLMTVDEKLYVSWSTFAFTADLIQKFGTFELTVPKRSGLGDSWDALWSVEYDGRNLVAQCVELYRNNTTNS